MCDEEKQGNYSQPFSHHDRFFKQGRFETYDEPFIPKNENIKCLMILYNFWEKQLLFHKSVIFDEACKLIFPQMKNQKDYLNDPKSLSLLILT